jgi:glucokinase
MTLPSFLGLNIGGTTSSATVGGADGAILARSAGSTPAEGVDAGMFLTGLLTTALNRSGLDLAEIQAVGVSYGGPVDAAGNALTPPNLPGWAGFDLRSTLAAWSALPVFIANDANATALAEHRWGAGQGIRNMAFLTLGTGIGAGLILDGRLYAGRDGLAGEIGHVTLEAGGPLCACGKRGCLEALASGTALARMGRERYGDPGVSAHDVVARARGGDPVAVAIVREAGRWLGVGLAFLIQTLNLERIVLGTLAVAAGDLLLPEAKAVIAEAVWPNLAEGVEIVPAALGHDGQDMAALAVALSHRQTAETPAATPSL